MSGPPVGLFGRIAVHLQLITAEQLRHALGVCGRSEGGKRLGDILMDLGYLSADQVEPPREAPIARIALKSVSVEASASTAKRIETLLTAAAKYGASDLHVHVGQPVLMRVHGRLLASKTPPTEPEAAERDLLEILTSEQRNRFLDSGDLGFAYEIPGQLRARVTYCRHLLLRRCDQPGRVAATEVLVRTSGLANIIREGNISMLVSIIQSGKKDGMQSMDDCLMGLVEGGKVSAKDAFLKAADKTRFETASTGAGPPRSP